MYVPATPALTAPFPAMVASVSETSASVPPVPLVAMSLSARRSATTSSGRRSTKKLLGGRHSTHSPAAYRLVEVSWYGGGGSLACGGSLTSSTMGVANRTLPCGTRVTLHYHGRTVRVRVVDRGPYVAGREYDLTEATARTLRFDGVGEMGVRVSGSPRRRR
jgi:rare lipoprotein A (peptidoglycan hydrolase)